MTPRDILEKAHGLGLTLVAEGDKLHVQGAEPAPELIEAIRQNKPAVIALLKTLPTFTAEQEKALCDWYSTRPREERLMIHLRGVAIRRDRQYPFHVADLEAIRERRKEIGA